MHEHENCFLFERVAETLYGKNRLRSVSSSQENSCAACVMYSVGPYLLHLIGLQMNIIFIKSSFIMPLGCDLVVDLETILNQVHI